MSADPIMSQNILLVNRLIVRGVGDSARREPCFSNKAGSAGEAGGDSTRWLKLKREDVEDSGPFAYDGLAEGGPLEALRRSDIRGALLGLRVAWSVRSRWFFMVEYIPFVWCKC